MVRPGIRNSRNILMELRKVCQHPYLSAPELEDLTLPEAEQQKRLIQGSGKLAFLRLLLPKLKEKKHRVLLFSQFKIALDRVEDFLIGEGFKYLRLDGDIQQAQRQKSMDRFNAPDSEYFIFLLTTRAGGVGINLATADTVIVYDPDFNPHQDLQAIARSHRYGQKKPVLVFKLMTRLSVEEQIVYKGKKKMVLDHLVVQNLHTEDEDYDVDNIIMHGTRALYEEEVDGVAKSDIVYNSKNVDELIDQVERQAEEEAKVLAERYAAEDEAREKGEKKELSKEAKAFGFAKIWEAGPSGIRDIEDEEEQEEIEEVEEDEAGLANVVESARIARERREKAELDRRARRERDAIKEQNRKQYEKEIEEALEMEENDDDSPDKKKLGKKSKDDGKKSKGKGKQTDSSDAEFALIGTQESDSDDGSSAGEHDVLIGPDGNPINVRGIISDQHGPGAARLARKQQKAIAKAEAKRLALEQQQQNGGPSVPPLVAVVRQPADITWQQAQLDREEVKANKAKQRLELMRSNFQLQERADLYGKIEENGGDTRSIHTPIRLPEPAAPAQPFNLVQLVKIRDGQQVLQWLYHVLREFIMPGELDLWARVCLPELHPTLRKQLYDTISLKVDNTLKRIGQEEFFTTPKSKDAVEALIKSGQPVIPSSTYEDEKDVMLPYPGENNVQPGDSAPPLRITAPAAQPNGSEVPHRMNNLRKSTNPSGSRPGSRPPSAAPITSRPPINANGHLGPSASSSSIAQGPAMRPAPPKTISLSNSTPRTSSPPHLNGIVSQNGMLASQSQSTFTATQDRSRTMGGCPICKKEDHSFTDCKDKPKVADLQELARIIVEGDEEIETKRTALREINSILRLYRADGVSVSTVDIPDEPPLHKQLATPTLTNGSKNHANGYTNTDTPSLVLKDTTPSLNISNKPIDRPPGPNSTRGKRKAQTQQPEIIVIEDDSEPEQRSQRTPKKVKNEHNHSQPTPSPRGRPKKVPHCPICGDHRYHIAAACPVVLAGRKSIRSAMTRFKPSDPIHDLLQTFYDNAPESNEKNFTEPETCAFCGEGCGNAIRDCVVGKGGRKALKDTVRRLNSDLEKGLNTDEARLEALYEVYQAWPKDG